MLLKYDSSDRPGEPDLRYMDDIKEFKERKILGKPSDYVKRSAK